MLKNQITCNYNIHKLKIKLLPQKENETLHQLKPKLITMPIVYDCYWLIDNWSNFKAITYLKYLMNSHGKKKCISSNSHIFDLKTKGQTSLVLLSPCFYSSLLQFTLWNLTLKIFLRWKIWYYFLLFIPHWLLTGKLQMY